jgi:hypothetical protein
MSFNPGSICKIWADALEAEVPAREYWASRPGPAPAKISPPCAGMIIELWSHPQFEEFGWARVLTSSGVGWVSLEDIEVEVEK